MATRSCAYSPSTSLTITRHQVKSLFIGLCNSFANCCCQLIFSLDGFFSFLRPISCFCFVFIIFLARKWLHCLSLYGTGSSDFNIFLSASFLHFPSSLHTPLSTSYCIAAKSVAPVCWSHISSISSVLLSCLSFMSMLSCLNVMDYRALYIYTLVVSIHFLVWAIYLLLSVYLLTHHMDQI